MKKVLRVCRKCNETFGTYNENDKICQRCINQKEQVICISCKEDTEEYLYHTLTEQKTEVQL
jgi:hypothetical protein